jgi:hypothetical protein
MKEPNVPQIITHKDMYRNTFIELDRCSSILIDTKN